MDNIYIILVSENEDSYYSRTFNKNQLIIINNKIHQNLLIEPMNLDFKKQLLFYYNWSIREEVMVWTVLQEHKPIYLEISENKVNQTQEDSVTL